MYGLWQTGTSGNSSMYLLGESRSYPPLLYYNTHSGVSSDTEIADNVILFIHFRQITGSFNTADISVSTFCISMH
ncbi:MAG: hypothetical protein QM654_06990 [Dysgonamonadaceae bacterium]